MKIKDMFLKDIERDIQGVIKVGQDDSENIKQELEEYVVTKEMQKHFSDFFNAYHKGIKQPTDKIGVWISGFFGSGKSHFLKILSYLLENREVDGKKALDYFIDDNKIIDQMVLANMKEAASVPTDVVLFNIDSKSSGIGTKKKDSILEVFLKVFNEMQGFSIDPHLADLERNLSNEGRYEDFQKRFFEKSGKTWERSRKNFRFERDSVVETLVDINFMTQAAADEWSQSTVNEYTISISDFAHMVKDYLDAKGNDHRIVFLVDEMGQYAGEDTDLMLNLQTITEDLGAICNGKAWIIVTGQQDIDSLTEVKGNDFSKIQGRFDTRLNLTSANVDEVIKLRILEKDEVSHKRLEVLYQNNENLIKNLIVFNDDIDKKLYKDDNDFASVYPFVPYQFNLLSNTLTAIRQHGASGKHLSEGERSMLALFKESSEHIKDMPEGTLIPFYLFYDGLSKFLDHSHSLVISGAQQNETILSQENHEMIINVLKVLFLIRNVKEIEPNIDNITTLMISNINDDRLKIKDEVMQSLRVLEQQTLIQKNGNLYNFLTNEEQEINQEINRQAVSDQLINREIAKIIFDDIINIDKVSVGPHGNRYLFSFDKIINNDPYPRLFGHVLKVEIVTPLSELNRQETQLLMQTTNSDHIIVDLPSDSSYIEEIKTQLKIDAYIRKSASSTSEIREQIIAGKRAERKNREDRAKMYLKDALTSADIYYSGNKTSVDGNNFKSTLHGIIVDTLQLIFSKLDYIDVAKEKADIKSLLKSSSGKELTLNIESNENNEAINEVEKHIKNRSFDSGSTTVKMIKDAFNREPFGYIDLDIEWILAKMLVNDQISLTYNGELVNLVNSSVDEMMDYLSNRNYDNKVVVKLKDKIDEHFVKSMKNIASDVFDTDILSNDTDSIEGEFRELLNKEINELQELLVKYDETSNYPGKPVIKEGIELLKQLAEIKGIKEIFMKTNQFEDDLLAYDNEVNPVKSFFRNHQVDIWDESTKHTKVFNTIPKKNQATELKETNKLIREILILEKPYNSIHKLTSYNSQFKQQYQTAIATESKPIELKLKRTCTETLNELKNNELISKESSIYEDLKEKIESQFEVLNKELNTITDINLLSSFDNKISDLNTQLYEMINKKSEELIQKQKGDKDSNSIIRYKNFNARDLSEVSTWRIESLNDFDEHVKELREKIEKELDENTIVRIEL